MVQRSIFRPLCAIPKFLNRFCRDIREIRRDNTKIPQCEKMSLYFINLDENIIFALLINKVVKEICVQTKKASANINMP